MIYLQDISKNNGSGVWDFIYVVFQASRMGQCFDMIQISHIYIYRYTYIQDGLKPTTSFQWTQV